MPKIVIRIEMETVAEAVEFLSGKLPIEPIPVEPIEPEPVEPIEPIPVEPVEPTPPEPVEPVEPEVSIEIDKEDLPTMATVGFDLTQDLDGALPLMINKSDTVAVKLEKVQGWVWRIAECKNVQLLMPFENFLIIKCLKSNTETYVNFEMINETNTVGVSLYVEFAVAN